MSEKKSKLDLGGSSLKVVHFMRRPRSGIFSVEQLHADIRSNLDDTISVDVRENKYFSSGLFKRLADAVTAIRYQGDVNHVTGDTHYITFFLRRKTTILTILDCVPLERSRGVKFWLLWFFWFWLPEKCSSQIVVISEATKKQVVRHLNCDPRKIRVIHCNVSDEFKAHTKCFDENSPRILHIGTSENKNLERHIEALSQLSCTLVVIGELSSAQLAILETSGLKYENLSNLSREDVVNEYRRSDLLLFSSLYEGFGLPILEAQSVGRPVITSNIWSMPEVAGRGAVYVDPYSIESIRSGVIKVINSPEYRKNLIRLGFENSKKFTAKDIGAQYVRLYQEVSQNAFTTN